MWIRKVASVKSTDRLPVIQCNSFIHAGAAATAADENAIMRRYRYNRYASLMPMLRLEKSNLDRFAGLPKSCRYAVYTDALMLVTPDAAPRATP